MTACSAGLGSAPNSLRRVIRSVPIGLGLVALVLAACGDDNETAPDRPSAQAPTQQNEPVAPPSTTSSGDRGAIERRLVRYFERNFEAARWYGDVRRFEIKGGTPVPNFDEIENAIVVVHTTLGAPDRAAAREICAGVFGADVADVGGTVRVLAEGGRLLTECPSDL